MTSILPPKTTNQTAKRNDRPEGTLLCLNIDDPDRDATIALTANIDKSWLLVVGAGGGDDLPAGNQTMMALDFSIVVALRNYLNEVVRAIAHPQGAERRKQRQAKEDEHRDDTVAALVKMIDEDDTDQAKAIYDAIALIEGENG